MYQSDFTLFSQYTCLVFIWPHPCFLHYCKVRYRKIRILSTSAYFKIGSQNGCLFSKGAYFHGVLINTCNFLVSLIVVVWEQISCVYFKPRGSFSATFCPLFIAFLQPEIQSAIDSSLLTPAHQHKAPGTNGSVRGYC